MHPAAHTGLLSLPVLPGYWVHELLAAESLYECMSPVSIYNSSNCHCFASSPVTQRGSCRPGSATSGPGKRLTEKAKQPVIEITHFFNHNQHHSRLCVHTLGTYTLTSVFIVSLISPLDGWKKHTVTMQLIMMGNVRRFLKFHIEAQLLKVKAPGNISRELSSLSSPWPRCPGRTYTLTVRLDNKSLCWGHIASSFCSLSLSPSLHSTVLLFVLLILIE